MIKEFIYDYGPLSWRERAELALYRAGNVIKDIFTNPKLYVGLGLLLASMALAGYNNYQERKAVESKITIEKLLTDARILEGVKE